MGFCCSVFDGSEIGQNAALFGGLGDRMRRSKKSPFKGRQFTAEVILRAVRWYLQFQISDCDLERMLADRDVAVDHTMLFRWIQAYAAELDKRLRPHLCTTNVLLAGR